MYVRLARVHIASPNDLGCLYIVFFLRAACPRPWAAKAVSAKAASATRGKASSL